MAYGQRDPDALTDRNSDRVRILKFLARHPEGISQTALCHYVLKGVAPNDYSGLYDLSGDAYERHDEAAQRFYGGSDWVALDGSDDDYQFLNRFVNDLEAETDLVRVDALDRDNEHGRWVTPTHRLLDLISAGITETATESNDLVYDREFCLNILKSRRNDLLTLSEAQKSTLARSLRRYIQRVRDYRLAFDVHLANRSGHEKRRMIKPMATRFSDRGRVDRTFAMLQDSLEWGSEHADTAVFCTLTTDPRKFDSLYDAIMAINENFHALNQWLKTDPSTKADTRRKDVRAWRGPDDDVTGRPRKKLEYVKVLEFTSKGYPHLHVLYFDPPVRDVDGMPWLCDKAELSHQWNKDTETRTGQGRIVDAYPLVFRDDLDDLEAEFNTDEGFVSWYRYGDHDHSEDWIDDRVRFHQEEGQIDFDGSDENPMQKTAGSYIGKYLSETYALLLDLDSLDDPDFQGSIETPGKSAWWKLALYWCTQRRFWSPSRTIRRDIELDPDRSDIRRGVADVTRTSLLHHAERFDDSHALYPDLDRDRADALLYRLVRDLVAERELEATEVSTSSTTLARIEYLGAYHYGDLPASPDQRVNSDALETAVHDPNEPVVLASTGDRPPPTAQAWR
ncbi:hypothetical protein [Natrinema marinum]|uniref:hypothetical protein n=1 Tax=Natrinema marinum TaxID=2961598 RepID=UPI0020C8C06A|nr:hypothetical protein [Natrinema marinum]